MTSSETVPAVMTIVTRLESEATPRQPRTVSGSVSVRVAYIFSFIHSGYFYSASSVRCYSEALPLAARIHHDTAGILYRSFTPQRHKQLRVKDLPKVPTWRLERDSNPGPFGRKATNNHAATYLSFILTHLLLISVALTKMCRHD